jgi:hypothetical protein
LPSSCSLRSFAELVGRIKDAGLVKQVVDAGDRGRVVSRLNQIQTNGVKQTPAKNDGVCQPERLESALGADHHIEGLAGRARQFLGVNGAVVVRVGRLESVRDSSHVLALVERAVVVFVQRRDVHAGFF